MWSYYAQNHSGADLRFTDTTPNNPISMARPVRYVEEMPSLFDDEALSDMLAGYKGMDERRIMDELVYTKSCHWAHEAEWRIYSGRGRTSGIHEDITFNPIELDGVTFGARMKREDRKWLAEMLRTFYPHVQLLGAATRSDVYALAIKTASENDIVVPLSTKIQLLLRILLKRTPSILRSRFGQATGHKPAGP